MAKMPDTRPSNSRYWRINLIVIGSLLAIWAIVAYGCSILFVESLNEFRLFELPLGFWFANQGSMYVFVVLILVYAVTMDLVDRRFKKSEQGNPQVSSSDSET